MMPQRRKSRAPRPRPSQRSTALPALSLLLLVTVMLQSAHAAHAVCPKRVLPMTLVVVSTGVYLEHGCMATFLHSLKHSNAYPNQTIIVISDTHMLEARFREHFRGTLQLLPNTLIMLRPNPANKADNLNLAFDYVTQPLITQFDVDDYIHPQRLDVMHRLFNDHPDLEFVLHTFDQIVEPGKTCARAPCRPRIPKFIRYDLDQLKLGISYEALRSVWVPYLKTHEYHFCCGLLEPPFWAHNGWPTLRRNVARNIRYSLIHAGTAEDSMYFSDAVKQRFNVSFANLKLGLYNMLDNRKHGACLPLGKDVFAAAMDSPCT